MRKSWSYDMRSITEYDIGVAADIYILEWTYSPFYVVSYKYTVLYEPWAHEVQPWLQSSLRRHSRYPEAYKVHFNQLHLVSKIDDGNTISYILGGYPYKYIYIYISSDVDKYKIVYFRWFQMYHVKHSVAGFLSHRTRVKSSLGVFTFHKGFDR